MGIGLFDQPGCPFCAKAESSLSGKGVDFTKLNIAEFRDELKNRTGKTSAPSVWVRGQYVGGCNDGPEKWQGVRPLLEKGFLQLMASGDMNVEEVKLKM